MINIQKSEILWGTNIWIIIILNLSIIILTIFYCILRVNHYCFILSSKTKKIHIYFKFTFVGGVFSVISYIFFPVSISFILGVLLFIGLMKSSYNITINNCLFFSFDFMIIPFLNGGICSILLFFLSGTLGYSKPQIIVNLEAIIAFLISIFIIYCIDIKIIHKEYWHDFIRSPGKVNKMLLSQIVVSLAIIAISFVYTVEIYPWIYLPFFLVFLSVLILYKIALHFIVKESSIQSFEIRNKILKEQMSLQLKNYKSQELLITEVRKFKHDYYSFMNIMTELLKQNKVNDCLELLHKTVDLEQKIFKKQNTFSNNIYIQAILNDIYQKIAGRADFFAEAPIPKLKIDELDLCRLFSNLLNNALAAIQNEKCDKKMLYIQSFIRGNWFIIIIKNSYAGTILKKNNRFITCKEDKDKHGFGLKIVEDIVEDNNGFMKICYESNIFSVKILLPLK